MDDFINELEDLCIDLSGKSNHKKLETSFSYIMEETGSFSNTVMNCNPNPITIGIK